MCCFLFVIHLLTIILFAVLNHALRCMLFSLVLINPTIDDLGVALAMQVHTLLLLKICIPEFHSFLLPGLTASISGVAISFSQGVLPQTLQLQLNDTQIQEGKEKKVGHINPFSCPFQDYHHHVTTFSTPHNILPTSPSPSPSPSLK